MKDGIDDWWLDRGAEPMGSVSLFNALKSAGITSMDQFLALTVHDLLAMDGVERATAAEALGIQLVVRGAAINRPMH